jgi:hypothetical protein
MALEVVRLLRVPATATRATAGPCRCRAIEVVAFSDEEGTRFGKALLGSSAVAGTWNDAWWDLTDADGVSLRRAFLEFGLDPARVGEAARRPDELVGYLEAHIEQGPELDRAGSRSPSSPRSRRRGGSSWWWRVRPATPAARRTTCVATRCWARARRRWRSSASAPPSTTSSAPSDVSKRSPARST